MLYTVVKLLAAAAFQSFVDVIQANGVPDALINGGRCGRYDDLARLEIVDSRAGISVFRSELTPLPLTLTHVERHLFGSKAFLPLDDARCVVCVALDEGGRPCQLQAFEASEGLAVNYRLGVRHSVLSPIEGAGLYAVVDRIGDGKNLEEYRFPSPCRIAR